MKKRHIALLLLMVAAIAALIVVIVQRPAAQINGVGEWVLGRTVLADVFTPRCTVDRAMTWCTGNSGVAVGHQTASVDLYFRGHDGKAPLAEILLAIRACDVDDAVEALADKLGPATEILGDNKRVWRHQDAVIVGQLPAEGRTCEINFLAPSETRIIEYLVTGKEPSSPPTP